MIRGSSERGRNRKSVLLFVALAAWLDGCGSLHSRNPSYDAQMIAMLNDNGQRQFQDDQMRRQKDAVRGLLLEKKPKALILQHGSSVFSANEGAEGIPGAGLSASGQTGLAGGLAVTSVLGFATASAVARETGGPSYVQRLMGRCTEQIGDVIGNSALLQSAGVLVETNNEAMTPSKFQALCEKYNCEVIVSAQMRLAFAAGWTKQPCLTVTWTIIDHHGDTVAWFTTHATGTDGQDVFPSGLDPKYESTYVALAKENSARFVEMLGAMR